MFTGVTATNVFIENEQLKGMNRIYAPREFGDWSFESTLRALLGNRIKEGDSIRVTLRDRSYSSATIRGASTKDIFNAMYINPGEKDYLEIINLVNTETENVATFEKVDESLLDFLGEGYERLEDIDTTFFARYLKARVFQNEANQHTFIFADNLDIRKWHVLQSVIPRYFSRHFVDKPLDDLEKQLLNSLTKRSRSTYEKILDEIGERYNFREEKIKTLLGNIERRIKERDVEQIRVKINNVRNLVETKENELAQFNKQLNDLFVQQLGILSRNVTEESEIMSYFLCNKSLDIYAANEEQITFIVKSYLDIFDEELYERVINNAGSYFFYWLGSFDLTEEQIKKFFDAVFKEGKIKIRFCAAYRLNLLGMYVSGLEEFYFPLDCETYMPNPHIQYFSCLGGYYQHISECLRNGDIVGAIAQCISSAKNFNLSDSTVGEMFVRDVFSRDKKFVELPDGSLVTAKEAMKFLEETTKEEEC